MTIHRKPLKAERRIEVLEDRLRKKIGSFMGSTKRTMKPWKNVNFMIVYEGKAGQKMCSLIEHIDALLRRMVSLFHDILSKRTDSAFLLKDQVQNKS